MGRQTDRQISPVEDTIAAISTPTGEGGIGIIRLSGANSIPLACRLFRKGNGKRLLNPKSRYHYHGWIYPPSSGEPIDEVLLTVMRAPHSYTREDVVEISGHGGTTPLRAMLNLLCSEGARLAIPGEFTRRAFLNGRIDLTQAEAVLDTIRASTEAGLRATQRHLQGQLGSYVTSLRERIISLLVSIEAAIDFADEDIIFLSPSEVLAELSVIKEEIAQLVSSEFSGRLLREGAQTAIVGRPNTGKSSLLNALVGDSKAIVTEVPGTTRDVIEAQIDLDGIPLRLMDTAGIRTTDDHVEKIGVERSRQSLANADLILLVLDRSEPLTEEDISLLEVLHGRTVIILLNKADLPSKLSPEKLSSRLEAPIITISATTGTGLEQLRKEINMLLLSGTVLTESPMLANLRQREAAERAAAALTQAEATLDHGGTEELLAVDLMAAADALGEITGANIREDVINELFSKFCLGK